jgi:nucleoside-triphosphatase
MAPELVSMPRIFIVTGDQGEGKTSFVEKTIRLLRSENIHCSGVLALGTWKKGLRDRFYLVDLNAEKEIIYCQRDPEEGWNKINHFYINPEGQKFGEQALSLEYVEHSSVVVIDEIGPFELAGHGWARSLDVLLESRISILLIVVRKPLLEEVLEKWKMTNAEQFDIHVASPEALVHALKKHLNQSM